MKNKKADALAIELIDDLLDEEEVQEYEVDNSLKDSNAHEPEGREQSHLRDVSELEGSEDASDEADLNQGVNELKEMEVTHFVDDLQSEVEPVDHKQDEVSVDALEVSHEELPEEALVFGSGEEDLPDPSELKDLKVGGGFIPDSEKPPSLDERMDDRTVKLGATEIASMPFKPEPEAPTQSGDETYVANRNDVSTVGGQESSIRAGVGKFAARGVGLGNGEVQLAQSENLRIAQQKIIDLEREIERLRKDNENLAAAGETFKNSLDELQAQLEVNENELKSTKEILEGEKSLLLENLSRKEKEGRDSKQRLEELEMRLSSNIQKIRVRERELENRLELVKMENAALLRSKDELILDLKRQMDQLNQELDNYRSKGQELNKQLSDKQDMLRRTVKALRLSLTMLEGENYTDDKKKAQ